MAQQRRSRFTVRFASGDPVVCLAYDAGFVHKYYEALGRTVTGVTKGDHRVKARAAEVKAAGGFRVDQAALKDAIALLGLKLPVTLRYNSRVGNTNGNYRFTGHSHNIMLKSYHTAAQASDTLWHELCHAMQAERAGTMVEWNVVQRQQARYSYRSRPIEREAREMSATMANCPLTVAA